MENAASLILCFGLTIAWLIMVLGRPSTDSGWDYTLYDAASMKELDGGQLDMPEISRMKAVLQICDDNDLGRDSVKYAPLSMIETLQEAAYQQMQA